jgi:hypothetical protein
LPALKTFAAARFSRASCTLSTRVRVWRARMPNGIDEARAAISSRYGIGVERPKSSTEPVDSLAVSRNSFSFERRPAWTSGASNASSIG